MDLEKSTSEQEKLESTKQILNSTSVEKDIELDIDVGTLLASDYNALDVKTFR